jgi:2-oxoglutarate dehydrogenase complex dehydrogenase (E1) component-like enzyme
MGAYSYVRPRMATALVELNHDNLRQLRVMCRPVAAAATGLFRVHMDELKDLVDQVLTFDPENTGL